MSVDSFIIGFMAAFVGYFVGKVAYTVISNLMDRNR